MERPKSDEEARIWNSSKTALRIRDLGDVEKKIAGLLRNAATSVSLLTLPQTDEPGSTLPQGEERPEQFVVEVGEYFERLDNIQLALRSALSYVRRSRIAPSTINAPPQDFVPPSLGIGLPTDSSSAPKNRGLQEEKIDRDAWKGVLEALLRIKADRDAERERENSNRTEESDTMKE